MIDRSIVLDRVRTRRQFVGQYLHLCPVHSLSRPSPSARGEPRGNSSALIAYHVPRFRHPSHAFNSHTRPSSETPGPRALCRRVLPRNFTSAVHVCPTLRKIIRKKKERERAGERETERERVSEYLGAVYTPDSSGLRSSLVTSRTTMRRGGGGEASLEMG